jgi:hypothetical protein
LRFYILFTEFRRLRAIMLPKKQRQLYLKAVLSQKKKKVRTQFYFVA